MTRLIDADDFKKDLDNKIPKDNDVRNLLVETIKNLIDMRQTVSPVKNGWAQLKTVNGREKFCCGLCGYEYARAPGDIHNYCPACGAKIWATTEE